jgi:hypothetical protein
LHRAFSPIDLEILNLPHYKEFFIRNRIINKRCYL